MAGSADEISVIATVNVSPKTSVSVLDLDINRCKRIAKLENLLAIEIQRAAAFLRENKKLEAKVERIKRERDFYKKQVKKQNKVPCDRANAMIVRGEIDMSEVTGSTGE